MRVWNTKHMTIEEKKIDQLIRHLKRLDLMQKQEFKEGVGTLEQLKKYINTDAKVGEAFLRFFDRYPQIKDPELAKFLKTLNPELSDEFIPGMKKSSGG